MKPFLLQEANWKQVKDQKYQIALIPWGATEPHNYHLPYGTDNLETEKIAGNAAAKAWDAGAKVMVLPTIPFGVQNPGQIELPFCVHMPPSAQLVILKQLVKNLHGQGIKKVVILNGHGGNDFKPLIREVMSEYSDCFLALIEWFKLVPLEDFFEDMGDHAGEMETSLMMYLYPELVRPLNEAGNGRANPFKLQGLKENTAWTPRDWSKVSKDTGIGNPSAANEAKGEAYFKAVTEKIAEFLTELSKARIDELYAG